MKLRFTWCRGASCFTFVDSELDHVQGKARETERGRERRRGTDKEREREEKSEVRRGTVVNEQSCPNERQKV